MGKGFSCWPLGLFANPLLLSHRAILSASPPHWPAWDPAESGFTTARSLQIYRKRRLALWLGLGDIHQPAHLWSSRVWGPHLSGELERCGAVKGQFIVAWCGFSCSGVCIFPFHFEQGQSVQQRKHCIFAVLGLFFQGTDTSALSRFVLFFFFHLHLAPSQEKGLHIHPLRRTEVLPQGRCFLSLLIFFSNFFLDVSSSDFELSHEVESQSFFMHDDISGRKLETFLLNLHILGKKTKCMGGWKEILEDLVTSPGMEAPPPLWTPFSLLNHSHGASGLICYI